jgi:hypothetical protein
MKVLETHFDNRIKYLVTTKIAFALAKRQNG